MIPYSPCNPAPDSGDHSLAILSMIHYFAQTLGSLIMPACHMKPADKKAENKPAVSADPLGDLAKAKAAAAEGEPFVYYVQVGAFRTPEDAESHRAKLSLSGIETKVSEREQSGRMVYRVRVGPFEKKEDGERAKEKLDKAGLDTALVRVQR